MTRNAYFALGTALLITSAIFLYRVSDPTPLKMLHEITLGTYEYVCNDELRLRITFSDDLQEILLSPFDTNVSTSTLTRTSAPSGVRYAGVGIAIEAIGETMHITTASRTMTCVPAQMPEHAPLNFGD